MNYQKNQTLTVDIIDVNMLGFGVAKENGAVFFVQNAVTGDRARIRVIKCAKKYYVARIDELLVSSPYRKEPECPSFRSCGGCAFQHLDYEYEKEIKKRFVESCFIKEGLSHVAVSDVLSRNVVNEYRNKAQFPLSVDKEGKAFFGFFSSKSHRVVPVTQCSIQDPLFVLVSQYLCEYFNANGIFPYCEEDRFGLVRHIYLRRAKATGEVMLALVLTEDSFPNENDLVLKITKKFPEITGILFNFNSENTNVILGKYSRLVYGSDKITDVLCDRTLRLSMHSFYQVNHDCAELLYKTAFQMADVFASDLIVDLYCGVGSIGLATHASCDLIGIELVPEAVEDAKVNAKLNRVQNASFICGDASDAFRMIEKIQAKSPLVIVDPPRKGLSEKLIDDLCENAIPKILYISCGPDTLARDCKRFFEKGYAISQIVPVDMFPRTSHVESIALLCKTEK